MIGGEFRAGVFIAGLLLLAGCSSGSKGATPLPAETSATSAAVVTEQVSPPPVAPVAEKTAKGAEEFVRYFWAVHNYAYATLNTRPFEEISETDCTFCSSTLKDIQKAISAGSSIQGSSVRIRGLAVPPGKIESRVLVTAVIIQDAGIEARADGTQTTFPPIAETQSSIALQWTAENEWAVHDVAVEAPKTS